MAKAFLLFSEDFIPGDYPYHVTVVVADSMERAAKAIGVELGDYSCLLGGKKRRVTNLENMYLEEVQLVELRS